MALMLEARDLAYGYRGRPVGRGLRFAIGAAEAVCVLGPNGAGKTTLFKTLLGLLAPLDGDVTLDGRSLADLRKQEIALALAYVPQAHALFFPFTVADIVLMGRASRVDLFDAPGAKDRAAAEAALVRLGIEHLAATSYTQISGGERQLVLIARALAQEPRCLVMDEPTASLDLGNQARVLAVIAGLAREGLSVLFSSHHPDHAFACADRVVLMRGGQIVAAGSPNDVMTPAALRALYDVDVDIVALDDGKRRMCAPAFQEWKNHDRA